MPYNRWKAIIVDIKPPKPDDHGEAMIRWKSTKFIAELLPPHQPWRIRMKAVGTWCKDDKLNSSIPKTPPDCHVLKGDLGLLITPLIRTTNTTARELPARRHAYQRLLATFGDANGLSLEKLKGHLSKKRTMRVEAGDSDSTVLDRIDAWIDYWHDFIPCSTACCLRRAYFSIWTKAYESHIIRGIAHFFPDAQHSMFASFVERWVVWRTINEEIRQRDFSCFFNGQGPELTENHGDEDIDQHARDGMNETKWCRLISNPRWRDDVWGHFKYDGLFYEWAIHITRQGIFWGPGDIASDSSTQFHCCDEVLYRQSPPARPLARPERRRRRREELCLYQS